MNVEHFVTILIKEYLNVKKHKAHLMDKTSIKGV
jgi:hypothetical protein